MKVLKGRTAIARGVIIFSALVLALAVVLPVLADGPNGHGGKPDNSENDGQPAGAGQSGEANRGQAGQAKVQPDKAGSQGKQGQDRSDQAGRLRGLPAEVWDSFRDEFWQLWPDRVDRSFTDDQAVGWLDRIARDSLGFAGCEAIRRVVGFAKVSDIETLPSGSRERAGRAVLQTARRWLIDPSSGPTAELFDEITITAD